MSDADELLGDMRCLRYLVTAMCLKAGGRVVVSKDEFLEAIGRRLEIIGPVKDGDVGGGEVTYVQTW